MKFRRFDEGRRGKEMSTCRVIIVSNKRLMTRAPFSHYLVDSSLYFKDYETNVYEGADDSDEDDETYIQLNGGRHFNDPDNDEDAKEREFKLKRHRRLLNLRAFCLTKSYIFYSPDNLKEINLRNL
jgi:hypothetical protein